MTEYRGVFAVIKHGTPPQNNPNKTQYTMEASVQYGDFKCTSAANLSDHEGLEAVLQRVNFFSQLQN